MLADAQQEAIAASVQVAMAHVAVPKVSPGVVMAVDPESNLAEVSADGPDQPTFGAQVLSGAVFPGDRILIMFVPPTAAYVLGRRGGDYDPWHFVGNPEEPQFNTGWGRAAGTAAPTQPGPAWPAFRRIGRLVELRGRCNRFGGGASHIFTLPPNYRPENDLLMPAIGNLGGLINCQVLANGQVHAQVNEFFLVLDGITFSTNPRE